MTIDYVISGIWKNEEGTLESVFLHTITPNNILSSGTKISEERMIEIIKENKKAMTVRWDYETAKWKLGANVEVVASGSKEFLRSVKDASVADNLNKMINMDGYI